MKTPVRSPPLLATKLSVPPVRTGWVRRDRLFARLDDCLEYRLTLISAPAGFGKTTLLCAWVARRLAGLAEDQGQRGDRPLASLPQVAWLSLDQADNDPPRFWSYVLAALQGTGVAISRSLQSSLQSPPPAIHPWFLTALMNSLAAFPHPLVLVLDDYHLVEAAEVHETLGFLLDNLPPQIHLVIATRENPLLSLARWRARGELLEIRAADLRFTDAEAAQFLHTSMGLDLPEEDIAALERRTEGWIAGLQLAALSLQRRPDRHAFIAAFAGDDRYVMEYLVTEVLRQQPPHVQDFLLQTSILEQLTAPLCNAVTERGDSQEILAGLDRANLFVVPLDNRGGWYRYHFLFGELLRHRLDRAQGRGDIALLHRRAGDWCEENDLQAEAVHHALAAADWGHAAALIERYALPMLFRSEIVLPLQWMKVLPDSLVCSRPLLCVIDVWCLLLVHMASPELVEQKLQEAERALQDCAPGDPLRDMVARHAAAIRAFAARIHFAAPQEAVELSRQALDGLAEDDLRLRGFLTMNLASAYLRLGEVEAALRGYVEAQRIGEANEDYYTALIAVHRQAYLLTKQGRLHEAAEICRQALREIAAPAEQRGRPIPAAGALYAALGAILVEWNDLIEAGSALEKGLALLALIAERRVQVRACATLARLRFAQGEVAGALEALAQARPLWQGADSYAEALAFSGRLARSDTAPADLTAALRWAQERQGALHGGAVAPGIHLEEDWRYTEQLVVAHLLIAQRAAGAGARGEPNLRPLLQFLGRQRLLAAEGGWNERVIALSIAEALALQVVGETEAALVALERALVTAEPEGYVRVFLDHGAPLARLLYQTVGRGIAREYAGRLLAAMPDEGATTPSAGLSRPQVEALTERELEVMRLIAAGRSNQEIAVALGITFGTAKVHIHRIYSKLGVHSRTQAMRRGQQLGLLPPG
jgi:LuxR family maltose regulon positive regulatory protein